MVMEGGVADTIEHMHRALPQVRRTPDETLYPNADRSCRRQEEIITSMRKQHYNLPEDVVVAYKALLEDSKARLGLDSFVPWNQVAYVCARAPVRKSKDGLHLHTHLPPPRCEKS